MATIPLLLADGTTKYFLVGGTGTTLDPYITHNNISSGTVNIGSSVSVNALPSGSNMVGGIMDAGFFYTPTLKHVGVTTSANTAFDVTDAPSAGQTTVILDIMLSVNTNCLLLLQDNAATPNVYLGAYLTANQGVNMIVPRGLITCKAADKKFQLITSTAGVAVRATVNYYNKA